MIRRTASEVLRSLEARVASLEGGRRTAGGGVSGPSTVIFWGPTKNLSLREVAETLFEAWKGFLKKEKVQAIKYRGVNPMEDFHEDEYRMHYDVNDIYKAFVKAGFSPTFRGSIQVVSEGRYGTKKAFEVTYTTYVDYAEQMETKSCILSFNAMGDLEVFRLY